MANDFQNSLDDVYLSYMNYILTNEITSTALENCLISSPQFLDINVERGKYIESDFKILFVGQETFGWVSDDRQKNECGLNNPRLNLDAYVKTLKNVYKEFNIGADYYNSPIYQFIDSITTRKDNIGFLINNCLRHDGLGFGSNRIPSEIEEIVTFENNFVFREELKILEPDCVIFLTGPRYDNVLRKTFNEIEFKQHKNFGVNEFSILKHTDLPEKSFRIYHPNYHNRKGREYKYLISNEISNLVF